MGSVDVMNKLLAQMATPAVANARKEAAQLQAMVDAENGGFQLDAADWAFYAEKVRKAQLRVRRDRSSSRTTSSNHVLLDGVFYAANKLYGLTFKERHDLPVYEPGRARVRRVRQGRQAAGDLHRRLLRARRTSTAARG